MTWLILHINNYSITGAIIAYQTYPKLECNKYYYSLIKFGDYLGIKFWICIYNLVEYKKKV